MDPGSRSLRSLGRGHEQLLPAIYVSPDEAARAAEVRGPCRAGSRGSALAYPLRGRRLQVLALKRRDQPIYDSFDTGTGLSVSHSFRADTRVRPYA